MIGDWGLESGEWGLVNGEWRKVSRNNLCEVVAAYSALCRVDSIGCNEQLRLLSEGEVTAHSARYDENHVASALLNLFKCGLIGRLLAGKEQKVALLYAVHESLAQRGAVVVDNAHADVLHFLVHHPRHHAHYHYGERNDKSGQEGVAPYLQELFLYEILYHKLDWGLVIGECGLVTGVPAPLHWGGVGGGSVIDDLTQDAS